MPLSSESSERHLDAGRRALSLGDLATAESELRAAITDAEAAAAAPELLAASLASLAQLLYQARRFSEAAPVFARTLELRERSVGADDPSLVPSLHNLAAVHVAAGSAAAAEPLLRRALSILERTHGPEHPELAGVLNALSQLCLRRGAYADAEPLLKRLLAIRKADGGEERPEVATIMASLAAVHHALAEHDAAERLLRRVLEIRERTLAPNHFAIATSLEALAETCATRGKLGEALGLLERALDMRERTLEPAHPSLAVVRSKIADLQLQLSSDAFAVPLMEPAADASPVTRSLPPARVAPPAMSSLAAPGHAKTTPAFAPALTEFRVPDGLVADLPAGPNRDGVDAMRRLAAELDAAPTAPAETDRAEASNLSVAYLPTGSALVLPGERSSMTRGSFDGTLDDDDMAFGSAASDEPQSSTLLARPGTRIAMLGVALLTLAGAGALVARGSGADAGDDFVQVPSGAPAAPQSASAAGTIALPDAGSGAAVPASDSATREPSPASSPEAARDAAPQNRGAQRGNESRTTRSSEPTTPAGPATPTPVAQQLLDRVSVRIDPAAPPLVVSGTPEREAGAAIGALGAGRRTPGYSIQPSVKPAGLIGNPPQPRYPPDLRRAGIAGEVTISFIVDTTGSVDAASFRVIEASDVRFVGAVTEILPRLRFVAAESAGVKIPQRVEMPFRFNP